MHVFWFLGFQAESPEAVFEQRSQSKGWRECRPAFHARKTSWIPPWILCRAAEAQSSQCCSCRVFWGANSIRAKNVRLAPCIACFLASVNLRRVHLVLGRQNYTKNCQGAQSNRNKSDRVRILGPTPDLHQSGGPSALYCLLSCGGAFQQAEYRRPTVRDGLNLIACGEGACGNGRSPEILPIHFRGVRFVSFRGSRAYYVLSAVC